ncbi:MAG: IS21 family transposase [Candidatus Cryptobacteroides sp.]
MMLDYKDIITKRYRLNMSGRAIAKTLGISKTGVNNFLKAFEQSPNISFPLPKDITNFGIAEAVYGRVPGSGERDESYVLPDFNDIHKQMESRNNMTLVYLWKRYEMKCVADSTKAYQYRQFCRLYYEWCERNNLVLHQTAVIGDRMEVDFAGKTFFLTDPESGENEEVVVFVAVLPYSQYTFAEGMTSTKEREWIKVNNHALEYFHGVPKIVVCDNCKQAVIANKDWVDPDLNRDYAEWAEHYDTAIQPAGVRKPRHKSSVECAVGIMEGSFFHIMEERRYFSLEQFNADLFLFLEEMNRRPLSNGHGESRWDRWNEEKEELLPLPSVQYQYTERTTAKVSNDFHIRFDNSYYSVDKAYLHKRVNVSATDDTVTIRSESGRLICQWPRATRKGQWQTDTNHLPDSFSSYSNWNGAYFIEKAMTFGPNTVEVIRNVLASRKYEVQTYRLCKGILSLSKTFGREALEESCRMAVECRRTTYTFIKNSISTVAVDIGATMEEKQDKKNRGAYAMPKAAMEIDTLLLRSQKLAGLREDEDDN